VSEKTYLGLKRCWRVGGNRRRVLPKKFSPEPSKKDKKIPMKHMKNTKKAKLKAKKYSMDIPWLLETWMEQEKSSTQEKSAKNNNSSSNSLRKEIFRPKNSQKSGLNSQKHTIRILIHLKKILEAILTTLRDKMFAFLVM